MLTWKRGFVSGALNAKYLVLSYIDLSTRLYSKFMSLTIDFKAWHLQHLVTVACCSRSDLSKAKKIKRGRCRHLHGIEALICKWANFCHCYTRYSVVTYLWGHEVMQVHWKNMNQSLIKAKNDSRLQMRSVWRGLYWSDSNWKLNHHGGIITSGKRGMLS